jgi:hypothetical protein
MPAKAGSESRTGEGVQGPILDSGVRRNDGPGVSCARVKKEGEQVQTCSPSFSILISFGQPGNEIPEARIGGFSGYPAPVAERGVAGSKRLQRAEQEKGTDLKSVPFSLDYFPYASLKSSSGCFTSVAFPFCFRPSFICIMQPKHQLVTTSALESAMFLIFASRSFRVRS